MICQGEGASPGHPGGTQDIRAGDTAHGDPFATREELEELGAITRVLMAKFRRGEQQTAEDKKFHYTIYRLSHNQVMYQLILSISGVMDKFWEFPLNMEDPFLESLPLHEELYNAICERMIKKAQGD